MLLTDFVERVQFLYQTECFEEKLANVSICYNSTGTVVLIEYFYYVKYGFQKIECYGVLIFQRHSFSRKWIKAMYKCI